MPDTIDGKAREGNPAFDWSKVPEDAVLEIDVNGQKIAVQGRQKIRDTLQMGYRASERYAEANAKEKELEERVRNKERELEQRYEPHERFARYLESNPEIKRKVRLLVSGEAEAIPLDELPGENGKTLPAKAPGSTMELLRIKDEILGQFSTLQNQLISRLDAVTGTVGSLKADSENQRAINLLRGDKRLSKLATDDRIAVALEYQRKHGGDLVSAFKLTTYDELPAMVEASTIERFGINPESFELPGSSPPVVNGLTLDEKTLDALFHDPDEYAKHRDAIRDFRRNKSGKREALRTGRR